MAKFIVTSGSHFTPFTYDELVKPVAYMQQQHDAAQAAYDTLNLETQAIGQYISEDGKDDERARAIYKDYQNKLQTLQDDLWNNGINAKTKQSLSAARSGYAQVDKIKRAIEARQARSKEYWDARHKDPSLITGIDPGTYGLDNYLGDENYGNNWYTYSGRDFMTEVGADAKARADELLRDATIQKNKDLVGKLIRIKKEGFTSDEVRNAGDAVEAVLGGLVGVDALGKLSGEEQILADVLLSHLESTGARGQVSPEEFSRLINYGRSGLSQAIGKTTDQIIDDEVWKNNQEWNMWKRKFDYTNAAKNPTNNGSTGTGATDSAPSYQIFSLAHNGTTSASNEITSQINKLFKEKFGDEGIDVVDANGNSVTLHNPFDVKAVLDSLGKEEFVNTYGVDPDSPTGTFEVAGGSNGKTVKMRVKSGLHVNQDISSIYDDELRPGEQQLYFVEYQQPNGNWELDIDRSRSLNKDLRDYRDRVKTWKDNNKGVDIQKLGLTEQDWKKLSDEYHISDDVPREFYPYIMATQAGVGDRTPAYLMDVEMEESREAWKNRLLGSYASNHPGKKGLEKADDLVLYRVGKNGTSSKDIVTDYHSVLDDSDVMAIQANPEDVVNNKIHFLTDSGEFAVHPKAFGNDVDAVYREWRKPLSVEINDSVVTVDNKGIIHYLMKPLSEPASVFEMTSGEQRVWSDIVDDTLEMYGFKTDGVSPMAIVVNPDAQQFLRNAIVAYMNDQFGLVRDRRNNTKYKEVSGSTTKPIVYNNGSFVE